MSVPDSEVYKYMNMLRRAGPQTNINNTTAGPESATSSNVVYQISLIDKEFLKTIRILIKALTSLAQFIMELSNVLLMTRDQLNKIESFLAEQLGEL